MISEFGTFRHDGYVFLELCTKRGSVIPYNRCEQPTFVPGVQMMTSCILTSGSVFGHVGISAW